VTLAPKTPPFLCRVRPTKGRTNEGIFTDEQIIAIIKEQESGEKTADVCRRHGISSATFYKYKSKYGGMEPSDAKRLRALEDENGKLKKLLAEQMLDNAMLRDINSKKW
jgi:putative transposase|tara:strand:- start:818 stop:1144 length:327 start_codon:yes stop_codon:yes gene_type:complete